jgi:hypothetical protein
LNLAEPIVNDAPFAERTNSIEDLKAEKIAATASTSSAATDTTAVAPPTSAPVADDGAPNTAVRFASTVEEISHAPAEPMVQSTSPFSPGEDSIAEVMSDQIKELSTSLQNVDLQGRRLSRFAFEPYSLPASRVSCSPTGVHDRL